MLAPCDRSAIWLGKSLAALAFLALAEVVALPLFALFFSGIDGATVAGVVLADVGICAVGASSPRWRSPTRARELLLPLLFLPLAIPLDRRRRRRERAEDPGRYLGFLALYDAAVCHICWASFEYVVTE